MGEERLGTETIEECWKAVQPAQVSEKRFKQAICRWASIIASDLQSDDATPLEQREQLVELTKALRRAVKAYGRMTIEARLRLWDGLTSGDLATGSQVAGTRWANQLETIAQVAERQARTLRVKRGRRALRDKRMHLADLVMIWRWSRGQEVLGIPFRDFAALALGSIYGSENEISRLDRDIDDISAQITRRPERYELAYLPE